MKLVRNTEKGSVTLAEIQGNQVLYLHPTIQRVIDLQKCVILPALQIYTDEFGGQKVAPDHPRYARAVKIYLTNEWVTRAPQLHQWINGEKK